MLIPDWATNNLVIIIVQEVDTAETESAMLTDELKFQKFQHEHISAAHDTKVMLTGKDIPRVGKVLDL